MIEVFLIIVAYLLGSIPSAVIISKKFFGIDIRDYGSGNMGTTNTFRVLGTKYGIIVMVMDILKGFFATSLYVLLPFYVAHSHQLYRTNLMVGLGIAAVLGHLFPIFANFKGGKGIATLYGMLLAIQPDIALACTGVFFLILFLTKYVSLSSILAAVMLPISVLWIWNEHEHLYRIFAVLVALLVLYTHQKNILKLAKGTENKAPLFKRKRKIEQTEE